MGNNYVPPETVLGFKGVFDVRYGFKILYNIFMLVLLGLPIVSFCLALLDCDNIIYEKFIFIRWCFSLGLCGTLFQWSSQTSVVYFWNFFALFTACFSYCDKADSKVLRYYFGFFLNLLVSPLLVVAHVCNMFLFIFNDLPYDLSYTFMFMPLLQLFPYDNVYVGFCLHIFLCLFVRVIYQMMNKLSFGLFDVRGFEFIFSCIFYPLLFNLKDVTCFAIVGGFVPPLYFCDQSLSEIPTHCFQVTNPVKTWTHDGWFFLYGGSWFHENYVKFLCLCVHVDEQLGVVSPNYTDRVRGRILARIETNPEGVRFYYLKDSCDDFVLQVLLNSFRGHEDDFVYAPTDDLPFFVPLFVEASDQCHFSKRCRYWLVIVFCVPLFVGFFLGMTVNAYMHMINGNIREFSQIQLLIHLLSVRDNKRPFHLLELEDIRSDPRRGNSNYYRHLFAFYCEQGKRLLIDLEVILHVEYFLDHLENAYFSSIYGCDRIVGRYPVTGSDIKFNYHFVRCGLFNFPVVTEHPTIIHYSGNDRIERSVGTFDQYRLLDKVQEGLFNYVVCEDQSKYLDFFDSTLDSSMKALIDNQDMVKLIIDTGAFVHSFYKGNPQSRVGLTYLYLRTLALSEIDLVRVQELLSFSEDQALDDKPFIPKCVTDVFVALVSLKIFKETSFEVLFDFIRVKVAYVLDLATEASSIKSFIKAVSVLGERIRMCILNHDLSFLYGHTIGDILEEYHFLAESDAHITDVPIPDTLQLTIPERIERCSKCIEAIRGLDKEGKSAVTPMMRASMISTLNIMMKNDIMQTSSGLKHIKPVGVLLMGPVGVGKTVAFPGFSSVVYRYWNPDFVGEPPSSSVFEIKPGVKHMEGPGFIPGAVYSVLVDEIDAGTDKTVKESPWDVILDFIQNKEVMVERAFAKSANKMAVKCLVATTNSDFLDCKHWIKHPSAVAGRFTYVVKYVPSGNWEFGPRDNIFKNAPPGTDYTNGIHYVFCELRPTNFDSNVYAPFPIKKCLNLGELFGHFSDWYKCYVADQEIRLNSVQSIGVVCPCGQLKVVCNGIHNKYQSVDQFAEGVGFVFGYVVVNVILRFLIVQLSFIIYVIRVFFNIKWTNSNNGRTRVYHLPLRLAFSPDMLLRWQIYVLQLYYAPPDWRFPLEYVRKLTDKHYKQVGKLLLVCGVLYGAKKLYDGINRDQMECTVSKEKDDKVNDYISTDHERLMKQPEAVREWGFGTSKVTIDNKGLMSEENLIQLVRRCTKHIIISNGEKPVDQYGIIIKGLLVTNAHAFQHCGDFENCYIWLKGCDQKTRLTKKHVYLDLDADIAVVYWEGKTFPNTSDILYNHLLEKRANDKIGAGFLVTPEGQLVSHWRTKPFYYSLYNIGFARGNRAVISGNNTQSGMCGLGAILDCRLIGIHKASNGIAIRFDKEDFDQAIHYLRGENLFFDIGSKTVALDQGALNRLDYLIKPLSPDSASLWMPEEKPGMGCGIYTLGHRIKVPFKTTRMFCHGDFVDEIIKINGVDYADLDARKKKGDNPFPMDGVDHVLVNLKAASMSDPTLFAQAAALYLDGAPKSELLRPYKFSEAIKTAESKTSSGFVYSFEGNSPKCRLVDASGEIKNVLIEDVVDMLKILKHRPVVITTAFAYKDEVRSKKKIDQGMIRVFEVGDVVYLMVSKMYLTPIIDYLCSNRWWSEIMVGVKCFSEDWKKIYLRSKNGNTMAADSPHFDNSVMDGIIHTIAIIFFCLAKHLGYDVRDCVIVFNIVKSLSFRFAFVNGDIILLTKGNPSGCLITSIVNCLVQSILYRCLWIKLAEVGKVELKSFRDCVWLHNYGDDNVSSSRVRVFNQFSARDTFEYFGFGMTSCFKDRPLVEYEDITKIVFLKRYFVEWGDFVLCPLEKLSIFKSLAWTGPITINQYERYIEVAQNAVVESWFHGKEFHNYVRELVLRVADKYKLTLSLKSEIEIEEWYKSGSLWTYDG